MAKTLNLKIRPLTDAVMVKIPASLVREVLDKTATPEKIESILSAFNAVEQESRRTSEHDKQWLEFIINYTPRKEDGQPKPQLLTDMAKWIKLADRVNRLDESREGPFTLSDGQFSLIIERIKGAGFLMIGALPLNFNLFLLDFVRDTGESFGINAELLYDDEA